MGGIRGKLLLLREGGLEPREGRVQNRGELAEFAFSIRAADALRQVTGRDLRCSGADVCDRPDRACPQPPTPGQTQQQDYSAGAGES